MANEVKYKNQVWGAPITGQRLSTNGNYTGQKNGTPLQDAKDTVGQNTNAYYVEDKTIRYGTITQDTTNGSTPELNNSQK